MKNNYFVIHSTDPWLLARLSTDLMMCGYESDEVWNNRYHPFIFSIQWLAIYSSRDFSFFYHECVGLPIRFTLTEQNYLDVLNSILCDY